MKYIPKIIGGLGKIGSASRKLGDINNKARQLGSFANQLSGGKLTESKLGQKINEASKIVEKGTGEVSKFTDNAQQKADQFKSTLNRMS
eukprot:219092-Hanusia_phi.AAC.1